MIFSGTPVVTLLALSGAALALFSCTPTSKQSQAKTIGVEFKFSAADGFKAVADLKGDSANKMVVAAFRAGVKPDQEKGPLNLLWELEAATLNCSVPESNGPPTAPTEGESAADCNIFVPTGVGWGGTDLDKSVFELKDGFAVSLLAEIKENMPDSVTKNPGIEIAQIKGKFEIRCVNIAPNPTQCLIAVNQGSDVSSTVLNLDKELAFEIQKQTKKFANFEGEFSGAGKLACSTAPLRCEARADGAQTSWFMLGGPTEPLAIKLIEKLKDEGVTDDRSGLEGLKLSGKITFLCPPVGGPRCRITVEPIPE
jgi:hypothetical protein